MGSQIESFLKFSSIRFQLSNGLSVIFLPTENTRVLALQMWVKTGSIDEGNYLGSGISHFVEHMVFKGSEHRSYADIFKEWFEGAIGPCEVYKAGSYNLTSKLACLRVEHDVLRFEPDIVLLATWAHKLVISGLSSTTPSRMMLPWIGS